MIDSKRGYHIWIDGKPADGSSVPGPNPDRP
jgi:hypothetical protein